MNGWTDVEHRGGVGRLGERGVRRRLAGQHVERCRVTSLDRVDREGRGQNRLVLDRGCLAEVGRSAEVLDRGGELEHRIRAVERELGLRLRRRLGARLLDGCGERRHVLLLVAADLLDQRQVLAAEQAALDHVGVERRLEVFEREGVVDDADVSLAELGEWVVATRLLRHRVIGVGARARTRAVVVIAAGDEEGRSRTRSAGECQEPPPRYRILSHAFQRAAIRRGRG